MASEGLSLPPTFGIVLVALFLESILYGCGLLQAWLYFRWYKQDCWRLKSMILVLLVAETIQIFSFFEATYNPLINKFGDSGTPRINAWQDSTQLLPNYMSAFIVQIHFTLCIYHLDQTALLLPIVIAVLAVAQMVVGIVVVVLLILANGKLDLHNGLPLVIPPYYLAEKVLFIIQSLSALLCDILITVSLLSRLKGAKTGIGRRSTSLLNQLMINAVSRGGVTALAASSNFITLLVVPNTFYFYVGLVLTSKLYMNSALASLNGRQHIRHILCRSDVEDVVQTINPENVEVQLSNIQFRRSTSLREPTPSLGESYTVNGTYTDLKGKSSQTTKAKV